MSLGGRASYRCKVGVGNLGFYFPGALEKDGIVPLMPCSAFGTLPHIPVPHRQVSSEPALAIRTRVPLGSLGTAGLRGACLYRPESAAREHFFLDLIMWGNDLG